LFNMRLLVINMQAGLDTIVNNPGLEAPRSAFGDLTSKYQLDSIRATLIKIIPDHLFKELSSLKRAVKDLGQVPTWSGLPDREAMLKASPLVFFGERIGKSSNPFIEEWFDLRTGQLVRNLLEALGIRAGQEAIIKGFKGNTFLF